MVLPIPSILEHSLAGVDRETRTTLELFEALVSRLEPALKREIHFGTDGGLEFPPIVVSYLLASLQRMRVTAWGVITAINAPNEVLYVTAIRSMLESTANVCYLNSNLQKSYAGEMSRIDLTYLTLRMKFATRKPDDLELLPEEAALVSSVNVLTAMKALDRYAASELGFAGAKIPFDLGNFRTVKLDTSDKYKMVSELDTLRSEISTAIRQALANGESRDNPILTFCPNAKFVLNA